MPALQVSDNLKAFHRAFDDLGGARWRLTPAGLHIEGEAAPVGTGGQPVTTGRVWNNFKDAISGAAAEFDVPIEIIIATICTESSGNPKDVREEPGYVSDEQTPHLVSPGLMQTLISTARSMSGKLGVPPATVDRAWLLVARNSIRAGTAYMASQKNTTGFDPPKVACAYNAGSLIRQDGANNRWKMRQFPIGTAEHCNRWVAWFNDCFTLFKTPPATPATLPDPSYVKALNP